MSRPPPLPEIHTVTRDNFPEWRRVFDEWIASNSIRELDFVAGDVERARSERKQMWSDEVRDRISSVRESSRVAVLQLGLAFFWSDRTCTPMTFYVLPDGPFEGHGDQMQFLRDNGVDFNLWLSGVLYGPLNDRTSKRGQELLGGRGKCGMRQLYDHFLRYLPKGTPYVFHNGLQDMADLHRVVMGDDLSEVDLDGCMHLWQMAVPGGVYDTQLMQIGLHDNYIPSKLGDAHRQFCGEAEGLRSHNAGADAMATGMLFQKLRELHGPHGLRRFHNKQYLHNSPWVVNLDADPQRRGDWSADKHDLLGVAVVVLRFPDEGARGRAERGVSWPVHLDSRLCWYQVPTLPDHHRTWDLLVLCNAWGQPEVTAEAMKARLNATMHGHRFEMVSFREWRRGLRPQ